MNLEWNILFLFCLLPFSWAGRDFYNILQVDKKATTNAIKKAYRVLAKKLHPDKNKNDETSEDFQAVSDAYSILSDPDKRAQYDRCGEECVSNQGGGHSDGMDVFSSMFGDFGFHFSDGSNSGSRREALVGAHVRMPVEVTLEELYSGTFVEITRMKPVAREVPGTRKCNCRQEMKTYPLGSGRFQMIQETVCNECPNIKYVIEKRLLDVEIELGMVDGQETRFVGQGEPHIDGEPGDVIVVVNSVPHAVFERRGDDLYTNITISLQEALMGFTTTLTHLDGHKVTITREKITWPNAKMKKKGEGMPNYQNNKLYGTLHITFDVEFPKQELTAEEKELIQKIFNQKLISKAYNGLRSNY